MDRLSARVGALSGGLDAGTFLVIAVTVLGFLVPLFFLYPPVPPRQSDFLLESHSKLGLPEAKSEPATKARALPAAAGTVQSIWVYPLKSCRGIEVARSNVLPWGLEFDRLFTFAQLKSRFPAGLDESDEDKSRESWHFISQRQFPLLATVDVEVWQPDRAKAHRQGVKATGSFVVFRFPWREEGFWGTLSWAAAKLARGLSAQPEKEVVLPVEFPSQRYIDERGYTYEDVTIWKDTVSALNMEIELPPELQLYLGVSNKLALFRVHPDKLREIYRCAPTREQAGYQPVTGFQDAYPLHLLNLSSVRDLESKVPKDDSLRGLEAQRFRANIIVTGPPAYEEEEWKSIRLKPAPSTNLEECSFHVSSRTVRCKLPNVNPLTGERHAAEPDKTLRSQRNVDEGAPKLGCLGMQLTPLFSRTNRPEYMQTVIEVGMAVHVLERGKHHYIPI